MNSYFIPYRNSEIHYKVFGKGGRTILCFHGYGESADSFSFLCKQLPENTCLVAIDLPFHGSTKWENNIFQNNDLSGIIELIIQKLETPPSKLILLGFSLGGRLALSLFEKDPSKFDHLILLAPDGLKVNFWYWLATKTYVGNSLFRFTMKHPEWFFVTMNGLAKTRLVNSSIYKFVNYYIHNREVRDLLFKRWMCMRKFTPSLYKIKQQIQLNKTIVKIMYGQHDKMILPTRGKKFQKGIESFCTLQIIDSGHQVLHPRNAAHIIKLLEF